MNAIVYHCHFFASTQSIYCTDPVPMHDKLKFLSKLSRIIISPPHDASQSEKNMSPFYRSSGTSNIRNNGCFQEETGHMTHVKQNIDHSHNEIWHHAYKPCSMLKTHHSFQHSLFQFQGLPEKKDNIVVGQVLLLYILMGSHHTSVYQLYCKYILSLL